MLKLNLVMKIKMKMKMKKLQAKLTLDNQFKGKTHQAISNILKKNNFSYNQRKKFKKKSELKHILMLMNLIISRIGNML